jgi:hypothetical protein
MAGIMKRIVIAEFMDAAAVAQLLKTAPNMAGYYPGTPQDWYRQAYNAKLNEPIGTAQAASHLEPGRRWIQLSFYGLMFHDRKAAGPYRLGTVALATAGRMPNALNDLVENAYVTKGYKLGTMTAVSFAEPKLLESASRLEAEAMRSQVAQ